MPSTTEKKNSKSLNDENEEALLLELEEAAMPDKKDLKSQIKKMNVYLNKVNRRIKQYERQLKQAYALSAHTQALLDEGMKAFAIKNDNNLEV